MNKNAAGSSEGADEDAVSEPKAAAKVVKERAARGTKWRRWIAAGLGAAVSLALVALLTVIAGEANDNILQRMAVASGWLMVAALLLAAASLIFACAVAWPDRFDKGWLQLEKVLSSGAFYFFAGLALLIYAIDTTSDPTRSLVHPSLTFLLAMLGVAVMLFGTGSHAIGSIATAGARELDPADAHAKAPSVATGSTPAVANAATASAKATVTSILAAEALSTDAEKGAALTGLRAQAEETVNKTIELAAAFSRPAASRAWGPFSANAAIAGGAAVLTALFGWGVIEFRSEIKDVFGYYDRYVRVRIDACAAFRPTCEEAADSDAIIPTFTLEDYTLSAEHINGAPIFAVKSGNELQLLIFSESIEQNIAIRLKIARKPDSAIEVAGAEGPEIDDDLRLILNPKNFKEAAKPTPAESEEPAPEQRKPAVQCTQYSGTKPVKCSLAFVDGDVRGEQVHTVLYSLNFYRPDNAPGEVKVGDVDVVLE